LPARKLLIFNSLMAFGACKIDITKGLHPKLGNYIVDSLRSKGE
jgi:hypothetical protein